MSLLCSYLRCEFDVGRFVFCVCLCLPNIKTERAPIFVPGRSICFFRWPIVRTERPSCVLFELFFTLIKFIELLCIFGCMRYLYESCFCVQRDKPCVPWATSFDHIVAFWKLCILQNLHFLFQCSSPTFRNIDRVRVVSLLLSSDFFWLNNR